MIDKNALGSWSFLVGVVIAVLVGLGNVGGVGVELNTTVATVLALLGLLMGLLAVGARDVEPFVMASLLILVAAFVGKESALSQVTFVNLGTMLDALVSLMVPAAVVVALKETFELAASK